MPQTTPVATPGTKRTLADKAGLQLIAPKVLHLCLQGVTIDVDSPIEGCQELLEHPEIMTQGETLEELEKNLRDAYCMIVLEDLPADHQMKEIA
jgi:hypothetical protein